MLLGRLGGVVPIMALAVVRAKEKAPPSLGAFPTHGPLFVVVLIGVVLIVALLQFFPILALGPLAEHFMLAAGKNVLKFAAPSRRKPKGLAMMLKAAFNVGVVFVVAFSGSAAVFAQTAPGDGAGSPDKSSYSLFNPTPTTSCATCAPTGLQSQSALHRRPRAFPI